MNNCGKAGWKNLALPAGSQLIKVHNFAFMFAGKTFSIEIDEYAAGKFTGHAEAATDKSLVIESVTGATQEECIEQLLKKIQNRES